MMSMYLNLDEREINKIENMNYVSQNIINLYTKKK